MQELLQAELRGVEDRGIIASVDVPTDWVSSMVVEQKKNGKLRLCLDPRPLNKALKRAHYAIPVIDDLLPSINSLVKARVFSVCDLRSGFWHNHFIGQGIQVSLRRLPLHSGDIAGSECLLELRQRRRFFRTG